MPRHNTVKCIFCSKVIVINAKGNVMPHIVHSGKQCIGSGCDADQMLRQRERLDKQAKERK